MRSAAPGRPKQPAPFPPDLWRFRAVLCTLVLAAYGNSFGLGIAYDGNFLVREDLRVRAATADNLQLILNTHYWWPHPNDRLYRPVTIASILVNYAVLGNGQNPFGYHAVNILLHAVSALMAFALAMRIFQRPWPAFFAAALWGVHPIGADAVVNIAGRADLLASLFLLAGLLLYTRISDGPGTRQWPALAAFFTTATLGIFAKETGAILIGLMLLWDITCARTLPWTKTRFAAYALAGVSVALLLFMRARAFRGEPWPLMHFVNNPLRGSGFLIARLTALKVIAFDLWLLVCPIHLASDRSYREIGILQTGDVLAWAGIAAVLAILAAVLIRYRKDPILFWAAGFFGIALLPASNLLTIIGSIMAERFLYLPSLGFAIALTALLYRIRNQKAVPLILGGLVLLMAGRTLARNPAWNDDFTLAAADVQSAPRNFHFHTSIANVLFQQDQRGNLDRAIQEQEAAWEILRDLPPERQFAPAVADLGMFYRVKGDAVGGAATSEGRAWYEKSAEMLLRAREASRAGEKAFDAAQLEHGKPLSKRSAYQRLYWFLGFTYWRLGRFDESIEAYRYGRALDPASPPGYDELANAQISKGDLNSAAITMVERGFALGFTPPVLTSVRDLYARIPGGSCAVLDAGIPALNLECAKVRSDLCPALTDLQHVYSDARDPARAAIFRQMAHSQYGCPSQ